MQAVISKEIKHAKLTSPKSSVFFGGDSVVDCFATFCIPRTKPTGVHWFVLMPGYFRVAQVDFSKSPEIRQRLLIFHTSNPLLMLQEKNKTKL